MAVCIGVISKTVKLQGTGDLLLEMMKTPEMNTKVGGLMDSFKEKASSYGKTVSNMQENGK